MGYWRPSITALAAPRLARFATMTCMDEQGQAEVNVKPRSHEVTSGYERAPARAMLRAVGMTDEDWDKPQVGVASSWNEITPCNLSLQRLAQGVKEGVRDAGGFPLEFGTISVSDGISMGHEVTSGYERAPARAMLRAVGMTDEDWDKPQVGVASSWNEITPCNLSLQRLAQGVKEGVRDAGGFPLEFGTISVSDGISMGHEG